MELLENIISAVMDTIEEFFKTFTIPTGRNLLYTWFVLVGFLVLSVVMWIFDIPCFLQPYEALTAVIIVGAILLIDGSVRTSIKKYISNLHDIVVSYREVEDDD